MPRSVLNSIGGVTTTHRRVQSSPLVEDFTFVSRHPTAGPFRSSFVSSNEAPFQDRRLRAIHTRSHTAAPREVRDAPPRVLSDVRDSALMSRTGVRSSFAPIVSTKTGPLISSSVASQRLPRYTRSATPTFLPSADRSVLPGAPTFLPRGDSGITLTRSSTLPSFDSPQHSTLLSREGSLLGHGRILHSDSLQPCNETLRTPVRETYTTTSHPRSGPSFLSPSASVVRHAMRTHTPGLQSTVTEFRRTKPLSCVPEEFESQTATKTPEFAHRSRSLEFANRSRSLEFANRSSFLSRPSVVLDRHSRIPSAATRVEEVRCVPNQGGWGLVTRTRPCPSQPCFTEKSFAGRAATWNRLV